MSTEPASPPTHIPQPSLTAGASGVVSSRIGPSFDTICATAPAPGA